MNMMIAEFQDWLAELKKSNLAEDKVLAERMDQKFSWDLAKTFIRKYITRCVRVSIMHYLKYKA